MTRTTLVWINRLLWTIIVGAVLALGILVSLGRHYLPYVSDYQPQLVAELNRRTGLHFSLGHISGEWHHLSPRLIVDDLQLYNPAKPDEVVLSVKHATVELGLFRSIGLSTVAISRLEGYGVHAILDEAQLGRWQLRGFPSGGGSGEPLLKLLLAIFRAHLRDTQIETHFFGGGDALLQGKSLQLQRAGDFRRLQLALAFAADSAPLQVTVETHGDPRDSDFRARGYAAFSGVDLTPVLPAAKAFGFDLKHGRIDGAAWLRWRSDIGFEIRGHAAIPTLDLAGLIGRPMPAVTQIKTEFLLRDARGHRQLWLPKVSARWGKAKLELEQLTLRQDNAHPEEFQLALAKLPLAPLRDALLGDSVLPDHARDIVATMAPEGELRNILLTLPVAPDNRKALRLRAEFAGITLHAWEGAPGATNFSGYLDSGVDGGVVDLDGSDVSLDFPHVYHQPVPFQHVRGQVGWQRVEGDRVLVDSGPLYADSDAGRATALVALDLPLHKDGGRPLMTLVVGLRDSGVQYRDRFLPYTLQPSLLDWLGSAVKAGRLPEGGFIYRGSLRKVEHLERTVQLYLDVRDGELAYQPEWPALHDLRARVWVDDGDVVVDSPEGHLFDRVAVSDLRVEMHPAAGGGEWLTVRGDASAEDDDLLRLLRESPLRKQVGSALNTWRWRGSARARLDLGIPLGARRAEQLKVDAQLGPGELTLPDQNLVLKDVQGPLNYRSGSGLQSPAAINGNWYGKPVQVKVTTTQGALGIGASGRVAMADLGDWLQIPELVQYAKGETGFKVALHIAGDDSRLQADSNLNGVAISLPAPYAKQAPATLPFSLSMPLTGERQVSADLGDWADLLLRWKTGRLQSGVLRLGRTGRRQAGVGQFVVTGTAPSLDVEAWSDLFARYRKPAAAGGAEPGLKTVVQSLHVPTLVVAGQTLRTVQLSAHRGDSAWEIQVHADRAAGEIAVPDGDGQPWRAHLEYLHLDAPAAGGAAAAAAAATGLKDVDPTKAIALNLRVDHLWRGREDWGWVDFQLRPIADGLQLQQLTGQLRGVSIGPRSDKQPANLTWLRLPGGDRSHFDGRLAVEDIGAVMQRWGYEKVILSKRGQVDAEFDWPGQPDQITRQSAAGSAELEFDDGRFLKASGSTTGALKVVGIFNFANLLRRLQLDFSDLFRNGISFDQIEGGFTLQKGIATIAKPLQIQSPSSRFRLVGQVDFNTDQTDMELVATLPVAGNLPWVAALAGGLPAAAGVYVASKLFENQVDKFSSAVYDIKGPWTDPEVKFRRIFDDKMPKQDKAKSTETPAAQQTESK